MIQRNQAADDENQNGYNVGIGRWEWRLPAAQEQQRSHGGDRHHVGVLGHEERGKIHAAVFGMESGHQLVLGFGKIERYAICFGKRSDHENDEAEDLGEKIPARYEAEPVAALIIHHVAKTERVG